MNIVLKEGHTLMEHSSIFSMFNNFISQTDFNKGKSARIFDRAKKEKCLIVMKNNTPSAIILSPEEYARLAELEENFNLLMLTQNRLENYDSNKDIPFSEILKKDGLTIDELKTMDIDAEIE